MQPQRIALLSAEYPPTPGGVGDYTYQLAHTLGNCGYDVVVLTIRDQQLVALNPSSDTTLQAWPLARWDWHCWSVVRQAVTALHPTILHIQYQTGAFAMHPAINFLPRSIKRLPQRPAIFVTAHDLLLPYLLPKATWLREWVTYRLLNDADHLIVTNSDDLSRLQDTSPSVNPTGMAIYSGKRLLSTPVRWVAIGSNIAVAPPVGFEREAFRATLGVATHERLIVYFGLLSPTKGVDVLLDALAQLPERYKLLIVGGAATAPADQTYAAAISAQVQQRFAERVIITGHVNANMVSAHLMASDVGALPFVDGASFRRGSLLALLAHGVPLVTTRPAGPEVAGPRLEHANNALLMPSSDPAALAAAISAIAENPTLQTQLAQGGAALAAQFAWPQIAAQHAELYKLTDATDLAAK
jgi:glycosyltransferase involved in cell wall biosynthesis